MDTSPKFIFILILVGLAIASIIGFPIYNTIKSIPEETEPSTVKIENGTLLVDGSPYKVRGVFYSPVSSGEDPLKNGYSLWINGDSYEKDFAMMKSAGINTIRVQDLGTPVELNKVLDSADRNGIKIIMGTSGPVRKNSADSEIREDVKERAIKMVKVYKDHPAILMWLVGNEINYDYKGEDVNDWYSLLDEIAVEIKKEDPNHPVTTANNDLKDVEEFRDMSKNVDVYGANEYTLNENSWDWFFEAYEDYETDKPVLITETGADSWNSDLGMEDQENQSKIISSTWEKLNKKDNFIGVIIFEWSDEWWKSGNPDTRECEKDWKLPHNSSQYDNWFSEECFGIVEITENEGERIPKDSYRTIQDLWGNK